MIFRVKPTRHIVFDPGLPLLNLVDEYDDLQGANRNQRAAELARIEGIPPIGIPFKHLVQPGADRPGRRGANPGDSAASQLAGARAAPFCKTALPMRSTG